MCGFFVQMQSALASVFLYDLRSESTRLRGNGSVNDLLCRLGEVHDDDPFGDVFPVTKHLLLKLPTELLLDPRHSDFSHTMCKIFLQHHPDKGAVFIEVFQKLVLWEWNKKSRLTTFE